MMHRNSALTVTVATITSMGSIGMLAPTASAQEYEDFVGSRVRFVDRSSYTGKGNTFRVDESRILMYWGMYQDFQDDRDLHYYVYEADEEYGDYQKIWERQTQTNSRGEGWYEAGPIGVALDEGKHYILAISYSGGVAPYQFFHIFGFEDTSFGAQVHGFAVGEHPMGETVTSTANDGAIYYQRINTVDPANFLRMDLWGTCPGPMDLTILNAEPGAKVALGSANATGGMLVDIGFCTDQYAYLEGSSARLLHTATADENGRVVLSANVGEGLCGTYLEAMDLSSCRISNVVRVK